MTVTYDDTLATDRDVVRLRISDTQANAGPRPDKRNFSDNELDYLLSDEGSINGAIAQAFEILVAEWTPFAMSEREGDVSYDAEELVEKYRKLANQWRTRSSSSDKKPFQFGVV